MTESDVVMEAEVDRRIAWWLEVDLSVLRAQAVARRTIRSTASAQ